MISEVGDCQVPYILWVMTGAAGVNTCWLWGYCFADLVGGMSQGKNSFDRYL
jgi:hypothetical protein